MNDKLYLSNYLMILKSTIEVYVHGTIESSNESVRKVLGSALDETLKHQANTYDLMTEYGWYEIDNVNSSNITKTINKTNNN